MSTERVQVEIYGQIYSIKGEGDATRIRELAAYIDARMKEVEKGTGTVDPHRVAILAALTIADECYRLRDRYQELAMSADLATKRMMNLTETSEKPIDP